MGDSEISVQKYIHVLLEACKQASRALNITANTWFRFAPPKLPEILFLSVCFQRNRITFRGNLPATSAIRRTLSEMFDNVFKFLAIHDSVIIKYRVE
jgi:hypothetical protein